MTLDLPLVETLVKQLPPSASTLRLLDLTGAGEDVWAQRRADIAVTVGQAAGENAFDAIVGCDAALDDDSLRASLRALRPGGRLIVVDTAGEPSAALVKRLETAGYTRLLVEELLPMGVLMRGEKPHVTDDTVARVAAVAARDDGEFRGRYVHLLIRQTPNKPVWVLEHGEQVEWQAVALTDAGAPAEKSAPFLLAFSSLPNAVAFMQPAVIAGSIRDVNKVAKFSRTAAQNLRLLINPALTALEGQKIIFVPVDPGSAETPDE